MKKQLDVVELTLSLCQIPSVTGEEAEVVDYLEKLLTELSYVTKRQVVADGRDNLLALPASGKPKILLTTHVDTVPPFIEASHQGEFLFGRGTCDAKGIVAAMICAAESLEKEMKEKVGLLFLVSEETDSSGAKTAVKDFAPKVDYVINGEPTDLRLAEAMKGALVFELNVSGKSGHSAYPKSGHSAVHQLVDDLNSLLTHSWPKDALFGETTLNIGKIMGGEAGNVIAESASAKLVMRVVSDIDELEADIRRCIHPDTKLTFYSKTPRTKLTLVPGFEKTVVSFGSDVPYLAALGKPLLIGPGSILDAHTAHEKVKVEDLHRAVAVYQQLCESLLDGFQ